MNASNKFEDSGIHSSHVNKRYQLHTSIAGSVVPLVTPITLKTFLSGSHRLFASYAMVVGRHFFGRERREIFVWRVCVVIYDRMTLMIG